MENNNNSQLNIPDPSDPNTFAPVNNRATDNQMNNNQSVPSISVKGTLNEIGKLNKQIEIDQNKLNEALEKIHEAKAPIHLETILGIVKKGSLETSFSQVYEELSIYIETCGNAIRSTNDNLMNVLDLVAVLTKIEADLYKQIGTVSLGKRQLLKRFEKYCEEQNITNESVKELLKTSLLRNRNILGLLKQLKRKTDDIQQFLDVTPKANMYTRVVNSIWFKTVIAMFAIGSFIILALQYFHIYPF
ncbi:MAG: hypothetical protein IJK41_07905 [Muribaculaceae bacterium]|nr:hypothetical protein [Muribaculaceae bacterium]